MASSFTYSISVYVILVIKEGINQLNIRVTVHHSDTNRRGDWFSPPVAVQTVLTDFLMIWH